MTIAVGYVLMVLALLVLLPVTVLLVQVLAAMFPFRPLHWPEKARPRVVVLVPAHDEATGIVHTLESVSKQLAPGDRIVVVADNCSDNTAQLAVASGAEVVERRDESRRGKGYALDCGVQYLRQDCERQVPDILVIVDADCEVMPGAIERISRLSASTGRPVQATYLMKVPQAAGAAAPIAEFAWIVKNRVRPLGARNLGQPCNLMGTGMAVPWIAVHAIQLANGHIVEDLSMGVNFARAGTPALFCPEALVLSYFASSEEGAETQRIRWEHGHLGMIVEEVPRLFLDGMKGMGSGLIALALDMCVPPLALLSLVVMTMFGLCMSYALIAASFLPLVVSILLISMLAIAVGLSWWRFGRDVISLGELLRFSFYAFQKIPLYLMFAFRRQKAWIRSKRDAD